MAASNVGELRALVQRMLQIQKTVSGLERQIQRLKKNGSQSVGKKIVIDKIAALKNLVSLKQDYRNDLENRNKELNENNVEMQYKVSQLKHSLRLYQLNELPASPEASVETSEESFGKLKDGREVHQLCLSNQTGMRVKFLTLGGKITNIQVPDK